MKFLTHLLIFALGGAIGIWWGVRNPTQANNLAAREQQIAAKAKIEVLSKLQSSGTPATAGAPANDKINQMIDQSKKDLDDANSKLQTP